MQSIGNKPRTSPKAVLIIGGGISGASCAALLRDMGHEPIVFEKESTPGGLVRCSKENGSLYHRVGGHVFNCKDPLIGQWFWKFFNRDDEFSYAERNAAIHLYGGFIGYPIENHIWQLPMEISKKSIAEITRLAAKKQNATKNLGDFFLQTFGETLANTYFLPYNKKIWQTNAFDIPLQWLDGKLPMPNALEIIQSNILREKENSMVHARFYYPKDGGSQFIVNRLLTGVEVIHQEVSRISKGKYRLFSCNGTEADFVIYTGNAKGIATLLDDEIGPVPGMEFLEGLKYNSISNILCECDANHYSWVYLPEPDKKAHRIIMTGNFSNSNNGASVPKNRTTCTVEFNGIHSEEYMQKAIRHLPFNMKPIAANQEKYAYVLQEPRTREKMKELKSTLAAKGIFTIGRFADWEYYNMDAAMQAAHATVKSALDFLP